ncbi:MAG TPA: ABC transporter substrate-binding protein [Bellilinea sp.]|nr:ABC transporter substrate-binding protein [Bellilinea sp.]
MKREVSIAFRVGTLSSLIMTLAMTAHAEMNEITIAQQHGIGYLPLMIMEDKNLLEKYANNEGLSEIKINWRKFAGSNVANEALLSGNLQFAAVGVPPLITMWAKTRDGLGVKGVAALNSMPFFLNTRSSHIRSIDDFTSTDKIALPAVKVSLQAVTLQMAASERFGEDQANRFDSLTVSMSHPDGMAALLSGRGEINNHFTTPPFQYQELLTPGIRTIINSYDVMGGPTTFVVVWTTSKFRDENPRTYRAFLRALSESINLINEDKRAAAKTYIRMSQSKETEQFILEMLNNPDIKFTITPEKVMKYAEFMYKVGSIKVKPSSWRELFFPEIHHLPGS